MGTEGDSSDYRDRMARIEAETALRQEMALRAARGATEVALEHWQAAPLAEVFGGNRHKTMPRTSEQSRADFLARNPDAVKEGWRVQPEGVTRPMVRRSIDSLLDRERRMR